MRNKKGFTLIELLVTIAIILSISVIVLVYVSKIADKQKDNAYKKVQQTIETAANQYAMDNQYWYETLADGKGTIPINVLVDNDYLNVLTNPKTGKKLNKCDYVTVEKTNGSYTFVFQEGDNCDTPATINYKEDGAPKLDLSLNCNIEKNNGWCNSNDGREVNITTDQNTNVYLSNASYNNLTKELTVDKIDVSSFEGETSGTTAYYVAIKGGKRTYKSIFGKVDLESPNVRCEGNNIIVSDVLSGIPDKYKNPSYDDEIKDNAGNSAVVNLTCEVPTTTTTKVGYPSLVVEMYKKNIDPHKRGADGKIDDGNLKATSNLSGLETYTEKTWSNKKIFTIAKTDDDATITYTTEGETTNQNNIQNNYRNINAQGKSVITYKACKKSDSSKCTSISKKVWIDYSNPKLDVFMYKYENNNNIPKRAGVKSGDKYINNKWYSGYVYTYAAAKDTYSKVTITYTTEGKTNNQKNIQNNYRDIQAEGTSYITYTATDEAGNKITSDKKTIKLDRTPPEPYKAKTGSHQNSTIFSNVKVCSNSEYEFMEAVKIDEGNIVFSQGCRDSISGLDTSKEEIKWNLDYTDSPLKETSVNTQENFKLKKDYEKIENNLKFTGSSDGKPVYYHKRCTDNAGNKSKIFAARLITCANSKSCNIQYKFCK